MTEDSTDSQLATSQVGEAKPKRKVERYLIIAIGALVMALSVLLIIYFWDQIESARTYGYLGGFLISILGGVTIIPAPSFLVIFTLGHALDPVRIGALSGIGEAIGGITVYLTGAGGKTIWSWLRTREEPVYQEFSSSFDELTPRPRGFRAKYQRFYKWIEKQMQRRGSLAIFVSSAVIMGPFYVVGLAAGSLRIGLKKFFLVSWAGKTVKGFTVAFAGYFGLHVLLHWIRWIQSFFPAVPTPSVHNLIAAVSTVHIATTVPKASSLIPALSTINAFPTFPNIVPTTSVIGELIRVIPVIGGLI